MWVPRGPPVFVISLNYSEEHPQTLIKSSYMDWRVLNSGGNGWQVLSCIIYMLKYISQGLCHNHWLWILFVPVFYIKRAQECVNRTDFTHWKWESESATERDLSSCQCLFINIQLTLPSFQTSPLSSAFILFSYSDSSLFTAENKTFSFPLTVVSLLSGNATPSLLISSGSAHCPIRRILAFEKEWHFKIKQGKTTHWNGSSIFPRSLE